MLSLALFVPIALSSLVVAQTYVLEDDYEPASFFNMFDFFTVGRMSPGSFNLLASHSQPI